MCGGNQVYNEGQEGCTKCGSLDDSCPKTVYQKSVEGESFQGAFVIQVSIRLAIERKRKLYQGLINESKIEAFGGFFHHAPFVC